MDEHSFLIASGAKMLHKSQFHVPDLCFNLTFNFTLNMFTLGRISYVYVRQTYDESWEEQEDKKETTNFDS